MNPHDVAKALEIWTLQNLLNLSILLGILAPVSYTHLTLPTKA